MRMEMETVMAMARRKALRETDRDRISMVLATRTSAHLSMVIISEDLRARFPRLPGGSVSKDTREPTRLNTEVFLLWRFGKFFSSLTETLCRTSESLLGICWKYVVLGIYGRLSTS